jgi:NADPH:quinone reductase-like Zn-dependent oxidoreductase
VRLGADVAIDYQQEDFVARTLEATGGQGADVVLDMVGGEYLARNMAAAAVNGRIAVIATQRGAKAEIDLRGLMSKRLWLGGSTLRPQSVADKGQIAAALRKEVWPLFESKALRPLIHARFPLREAARAHALMESGAHIGKIVLVA